MLSLALASCGRNHDTHELTLVAEHADTGAVHTDGECYRRRWRRGDNVGAFGAIVGTGVTMLVVCVCVMTWCRAMCAM
jgi:hypothetical protein